MVDNAESKSPDRTYLGPKRLLAELGLPLTSGRHGELALATAASLDPIQALLYAAGGSFAKGQQPAAMFHLFARSISDLVAGLHLLSHCYVQQAHSVIRPVRENCDLLDLFAARPEAAGRWMDPDTSGTPGTHRPRVRQRLERSADDLHVLLRNEASPCPFQKSRVTPTGSHEHSCDIAYALSRVFEACQPGARSRGGERGGPARTVVVAGKTRSIGEAAGG